MGISQEPTYIDGKINPVFQPDPDYTPFISVIKIDPEDWKPRKPDCNHFYELHDSKEDLGTPVQCVVCGIGRIMASDALLKDGKIVPRSE